MTERLSPNPEHNERSERDARELERLARQPETDTAKVEADRAAAEREQRTAAEKLEQLKAKPEREPQKLERQTERQAQKGERPEPAKPERQAPSSRNDRQAAYRQEIATIRQHLSPTARTLSRIVHAPVIETVSEALEETVMRPSLVLGGAIGALLSGSILYLFAKVRGYPARGGIWLVGLVVGAIIGAIIELIIYLLRRRQPPA